MIKFVKIGNDSYFTGENSAKYDPDNTDQYLIVQMDDSSVLRVDHDSMKREFAGSLYFEYNGDRYIIDDGYQDLLIKSGYIVLNNYDNVQIDNPSTGSLVYTRYTNFVNELLSKIYDPSTNNCSEYNISRTVDTIKVTFNRNGYRHTVYVDSISSIVGKNQQRKINSLPFYPFKKGMDKYGTLYISVFAQKVEDGYDRSDAVKSADLFIKSLMDLLVEYADVDEVYHFEGVPNKKMLHHHEGF